MNGFKEKKNISYIANALSNKNYIKSNIENIAEWITGEGIKLCRYKFFSEQEDFSKNDFLDLYNKNKLKTIQMLINKGVDVNWLNIQGETALTLALERIELDIANLLLDNGAVLYKN